MKKYNIFIVGGEQMATICASCISRACVSFMETLHKPAGYRAEGERFATIQYRDNHTAYNNFVVMEA